MPYKAYFKNLLLRAKYYHRNMRSNEFTHTQISLEEVQQGNTYCLSKQNLNFCHPGDWDHLSYTWYQNQDQTATATPKNNICQASVCSNIGLLSLP